MPGPVVYKFLPQGQNEVAQAFKNISTASTATTQSLLKDADQQLQAMKKLKDGITSVSKDMFQGREKDAKKAADAVIKAYEAEAKAAEKSAKEQAESFKKVIGSITGVAGAVAGAAAGIALATVGSAAREVMKLQEISNRISISSRGAGEKAVDPTVLRREFEAAAIANPGVKSEDIAAGTAAFVSKTGNLDLARQMTGTFATTASATGGNIEDIANVAAELFQKFDVKSVEDMRDAMASLTFQGKAGAFEMKDMAANFTKMSAAANSFNIGKGSTAVATLGGLAQMARQGGSSSAETATAVEVMFSRLTEKSAVLKGQGVNVFGPGGQARNIVDILSETLGKVGGGNLVQKKQMLGQIFGETGIRALNPLIGAYESAFTGAKGSGASDTQARADAEAAVNKALQDSIVNVGNWSEVQKDAAQAQQDSSAQLTAGWEEIKKATGEKLVPALISLVPIVKNDLIPAFATLIRGFGSLVDWLKTLPAVRDLFDQSADKEKKRQEIAEENDDIQKKINARLASPEHLGFDADKDPVLNALYKKQDLLNKGAQQEDDIDKAKEEFIKKFMDESNAKGDFLADKIDRAGAESVLDNLEAGNDPTEGLAAKYFSFIGGGLTSGQEDAIKDFQSKLEKSDEESRSDTAESAKAQSVIDAQADAAKDLKEASRMMLEAQRNAPLYGPRS